MTRRLAKEKTMTTEEKALMDIVGAVRRGMRVLTIRQIADAIDEEVGYGLIEEALQEEMEEIEKTGWPSCEP
jgi:hypothetical protein